MFGRKIDMSAIVPTSKLSLKISCLQACNNDIERANRLYEYLTSGMGTLPDTDPIPPSILDSVKENADSIFNWINGHRDDIAQGISLVKSLRGASIPPMNVDPIPDL